MSVKVLQAIAGPFLFLALMEDAYIGARTLLESMIESIIIGWRWIPRMDWLE